MSKIVQSGGFILGSPNAIGPDIPFDIFTKLVEGLYSFVKSTSKNMGGKKLNEYDLVDAGLNLLGNKIKKGVLTITGSGITLTNNEIKYIMKVIKSLENRGILLIGVTCFVTVRIISRNVSSRCGYSKENLWIRSSFRLSSTYNNINNFK